MDWSTVLQWIAGPGGGAGLAWLARRRLARAGSWVGRRLTAEKALIGCQQELAEQTARFDRQRAEMRAELAIRDQTEAYLTAALTELTNQASRIEAARQAGSLVTSANSPNARSPSPVISPNWPPRRSKAPRSLSRRRALASAGDAKESRDEPNTRVVG